ncbi:MAG: LPP20 family lipoprotein [Treponema sp.]|jgi:hypothetical protein|nr:LPP20 family lipoprotein [Treponema sp.]
MKKGFAAVFAFVLVFALAGCKSAGEKRLASDPSIPEFVANPPVSDEYIYGVGSSTLNNLTSQRQQAQAQARAEIAGKIKSAVDQLVIDYTRDAGTQNDQANLYFFESISRQITSAELRNVEFIRNEKTGDGAFWTLARMKRADALDDAAAAVPQDVYENEAARYAEFKANEALKMLDEQLKNR